jgi:replicative DNA helicase
VNYFITVVKRIDISFIPEYVRQIENRLNKKAGLICIDYLALLKNKPFDKDEYLRITDNMQRIKEYAKMLNIPFIVLSQVSRNDIKSTEGLSLFSGKGSGEVENSSDMILTLEKTKKHPANENIDYLILAIHKNRRGGYGKIIVEFDRFNLRMTESKLNYEKAERETIPEPAEMDLTF